MRTNKIYFRNLIQVALFEEELKGQLSDGFWENSRPFDHHVAWCRAEAVVAPKGALVGRNFSYSERGRLRDTYAFDSPELLEYVGDRMLKICRAVAGENYQMYMMKAELKDMKRIIKMRVDDRPEVVR